MTPRSYDAGALTAGLLFIVLGAVFLLDRLEVWSVRPGIILPAVVIGLGVTLVLGALLSAGGRKPD